MTPFPYENLSDEEFENLVIRICQEILGIGCKTFSPGKDGAKDSWFTGTATFFPSTVAPWSGTFNIQAKHTKAYNASCSDNDFSVNQTSILNKEISRLKEVMVGTPFSNYVIFTNRKLTGMAHPAIIKMLQDGLAITNTEIIGREEIDSYLNTYPHIANDFGLHKFISPLRFFEKELKEVILVFSRESKVIASAATGYLTNFEVINKEEKNRINNLSKDYFEFITKHSLSYFKQIEAFLTDPKNSTYTGMYSRTVSDLQAKIILDRTRFGDFMHLIEHLIDFVVKSNETELNDLRDKVRVFVHFMYFNCDIGKSS